MARRLNILLSAYFCSPYRGGESAVGWQTAIGLAKHHNVTVICGDHSLLAPTAHELSRYVEQNGLPEGLTIQHVQARGIGRLFHELHSIPGFWFVYYEAYRLWQKQVLKVALDLHQKTPFDIAHQLNIITCREPGYLWKLGIPWCWGPINGATLMPWAFLPTFGLTGCYRHLTRNILNILHTTLTSRCRQAVKHAAKVWTVTHEEKALVEKKWLGRAEAMIETGATKKSDVFVKHLNHGETLKLAWCGVIEARKALNLLLGAMADFPHASSLELHVIGNGPEEQRARRQAEKLGLSSKIVWHGLVSHDEAQKLMATCHVLMHTALKEGTPHVVLEAMSLGLPVICHDACGMGVAVTETCGIKVPLLNLRTSVDGFREAIKLILDEPNRLEHLSQGALARSKQLSWESHIHKISVTYQQILAETSPASSR